MSVNDVIRKFDKVLVGFKAKVRKYVAISISDRFDFISSYLEVLSILQDKKLVSSIPKLKQFVKEKTGESCRKTRRKDVEIESAIILMSNGFDKEKLEKLTPLSLLKSKKSKEITKIQSKLHDSLLLRWLDLSDDELREEFAKYLDITDLKKDTFLLFKGDDSKLMKREEVEKRIIKRIREEKAFINLGK